MRNARHTLFAVVAIAVLMLAGCTRVQYLTRPVRLPTVAAPVLAPVTPAAFTCPLGTIVPAGWMCLSDAGYTTLVQRARQTWDWGAAQAAIIKANNFKAKEK
jgi:hypothetical protein